RLSVNGSADFDSVFIGNTTASNKLQLRGGGWQMLNTANSLRMDCQTDPTASGSPPYLFWYNGSNQLIGYLGEPNNAPTGGLMGILSPSNSTTLRAGFSWQNNGVMFADVKQFREPNPRQPGTDIAYACIEGPEAAAYVRGTATLVNGSASVALPDHFQDVAVSDGMTVQLTPRSAD